MKLLKHFLLVALAFIFQIWVSVFASNTLKAPAAITPPGNALAFDGTNDVVNIGNSAAVQLSQGTIEAWIKTSDAGSSYRGIIVKQMAYGLFLCNNELIAYEWGGRGNISSGMTLNDNKWHHVAFSFSVGANTCNLYVDGVKKITTTFLMYHQGVGLGIGNGSVTDNIQFFNGSIDEVKVWNVVRTESQIQSAMYTELAGNESGLLAYYNFNQGTAGGDNSAISTVLDKTSNVLNGTLLNFSKTGTTSNFVASNAFTIQNNTPIATQIGTSAPLVDDSTQVRYVKFATTLSANYTRIALQEMKIFSDGMNIAVGKTIHTSSNSYDYNVSKVVDNDLNSSWLSDDYISLTNDDRFSGPTINGPHYVVVDLGAPYNLDSLKLDIDDSERALSSDYSFDFLVSTDATNWSLVDHKDFAQGLFTYANIQIQNIRYIKYACYYTSNSGVANVDEIQAFSNGANVARNKSATSNSGWGASSTVDGNPSTRWTSFALDHSGYTRPPTALVTYIVDLGEIQTVDSIQLEYQSATTYKLLVSANGTDWQKIDQRLNNNNSYVYILNRLPKVSSTILSYGTSTASCQVAFTSSGTSAVTVRGVCWSTSENPTVSNNKTSNGTGIGNFTATLTDLVENTKYYIRPYATNAFGTKYGKSQAIIFGVQIKTDFVSNISSTTATCGGYITAFNGIEVTGRGICWSTSAMPTIANNHTSDGTGAGDFTSQLTGLSGGIKYYVRAYVSTSAGIMYGDEYNFIFEAKKYVSNYDGWYVGHIFTESGTSNGQTMYTSQHGSTISFDGSLWSIDGYITSEESGNPPLTGWWEGTVLELIETPIPTITYDKTILKEAACNDGSVNGIITITHDNVNGASFTGTNNEDFVATAKAIVRNVPAGLTVKIVRKSSLSLELSVTGNATTHANANDLSNLKIMFTPDAFTDGNTVVTNGNVSNISLDFIEPVDISVTGAKTCSDFTITADNNLTLNNNSSLTINSATEANQITLNPGSKLNLGNSLTVGNVILKADDSNSFSAKLGNCMTINGSLTFEKNMLDSKWYFLSFPCDVNITDISMVGGGTLDTDFFILTYDGANRALYGPGNNWSHVTSGTLTAKKGYAFGLKTGIGSKTLQFSLNKTIAECENEATVPATFFDGSLGNNHKGWNLIGQPYLSKFSGSQVGLNYLTTWNGSSYVGAANNLVSSLNPFEAFFAQVGNSNPISFAISGRQAVSSIVHQNLKESLNLNIANTSGSDFSTIIFDNELSSNYEIGQDLEKWVSTKASNPQIYTVLNDINFAYNALPIDEATNLPVGYYSKTGGASSISAKNVYVPGLSELLLVDNKTGLTTDLLIESYNFVADAGTNNSRFSIIPLRISTGAIQDDQFGKPVITTDDSKLVISNLKINSTIRISDVTGKLIIVNATYGNDKFEQMLRTGMYIVQIESGSESLNYKVFVK